MQEKKNIRRKKNFLLTLLYKIQIGFVEFSKLEEKNKVQISDKSFKFSRIK